MLSAVLVVKNEEKRILRKHLENLKEFCSEIIVIVDSNSTDKSFEICQEYSDKVYYHTFKGIEDPEDDVVFTGIKYVTNDWFLLAEADFVFTKRLINEINEAIMSSENVAYKIGCCNLIFGKYFTKKEHWHWHYRLFQKSKIHYKRTGMHNREYSFDGTTKDLLNPVFHYGVPDIHFFIDKLNHYTSFDAPIINKTGKGGAFDRKSNVITLRELKNEPFNVISKHLNQMKYKDEGELGYIFSVIMGFYYFTESAKIYEIQYKKEHNWVYGDFSDLETIAENIFNQLSEDHKLKPEVKKYKSYKIFKIMKNLVIGLTPPLLYNFLDKIIYKGK